MIALVAMIAPEPCCGLAIAPAARREARRIIADPCRRASCASRVGGGIA